MDNGGSVERSFPARAAIFSSDPLGGTGALRCSLGGTPKKFPLFCNCCCTKPVAHGNVQLRRSSTWPVSITFVSSLHHLHLCTYGPIVLLQILAFWELERAKTGATGSPVYAGGCRRCCQRFLCSLGHPFISPLQQQLRHQFQQSRQTLRKQGKLAVAELHRGHSAIL